MISKKPLYLTILSLFAFIAINAQIDTLSNPSECGLGLNIADNSCNLLNTYLINIEDYDNDTLGQNYELKEVRLMIEHNWDSELDIYLTSPNNVTIELSTHNGSFGNNYGEISDLLCGHPTIFTTSPCSNLSIINGTAPFIGEFSPEGNIEDFDNSPIKGLWKLKVCDGVTEDIGTLEYIELIFGELDCQKPEIISVASATDTAVLVTSFDSPNQTILIEYGETGFIPGSSNTANQGTLIAIPYDTPILSTVLYGLTPNTNYEVYVRVECGPNIFSVNSCSMEFTTICIVDLISNITDFDTSALCPTSCGTLCEIDGSWFNSTNDSFDWIISSGPTASTFTGPNSDVSGVGQYIYLETSGTNCRNGNEAILVSNCFDIQGALDNCHMSFNYNMYGSNIGGLRLEISLDQGIYWNLLWSEFGNKGQGWSNQYIDLSLYLNTQVQFRFVGVGGAGSRGDIALDQIEFYGPIDLGIKHFTYFKDNDGDGYGNSDTLIYSCSIQAPQNYVVNGLDCDDNNININPSISEISCNGLDDNCDGLSDSTSLIMTSTINDTVCSGDLGVLSAFGQYPSNLIFWFSDPIGGNPIFVGNTLNINSSNNSDSIVRLLYYVEEQSECSPAIPRNEIYLDIYPNHFFNDIDSLYFCLGDSIDLSISPILIGQNYQNINIYSDNLYTNLYLGYNSSIVGDTIFYFEYISSIGCIQQKSINISIIDYPDVDIVNGDSLEICYNEVKLLLAQAFGENNVTFSWNTGINAAILPINGNGLDVYSEYIVSLSNEYGCSNQDTISVHNLLGFNNIQVDSIVPLSSFNSDDGVIGISFQGGNVPYEISWSGAENGVINSISNNVVIENLSQGLYNITINDTNNCAHYLSEIYVPAQGVFPIIDTVIHNKCFGNEDGAIFLDISGGQQPYSVLWSNGMESDSIFNLEEGFYSATISDSNLDTIIFNSIEIITPPALDISLNKSDITCNGFLDGYILISPFGGTPPYSHNWNTNQNDFLLQNLNPGIYIDTIHDYNNCFVITDSILILEPQPIHILAHLEDLSCNGANDGRLELEVSGGSNPFLYQWNSDRFTPTILNLAEGEYSCTITDSNFCTIESDTFNIISNPPLSLSINITNPQCFGDNSGSINIDIIDGYEPYTIIWNDSIFQEDLIQQYAGSYTLKISDATNCNIIYDTIHITENSYLKFTEILTSPSCSGKYDGEINLSISNSVGNTLIYVNNVLTTNPISNIRDSVYYIQVIDSQGCSFDKTIYLDAPQQISLSIDTINQISCTNYNDGFILLTALGTTGNTLSYSWLDNATSSVDRFNLTSGIYELVITSSNDCKLDTQFILNQPLPLSIIDTIIDNASCESLDDGSVEFIVTGGTSPYHFYWSNSTESDVLSNVGNGLYSASIFDVNGCAVSSGLVEISEPTAIIINNYTPQHIGCGNFIGKYSNINVSGGTSPYQYIWSNDSITSNIYNVESGNYSLTVLDATNNCSESLSNIIIDDDFSIIHQNQIYGIGPSCEGVDAGYIIIDLEGGEKPFQYNWSEGVVHISDYTSDTLMTLGTGNYNVTVTDNRGCTFISDFIELMPSNPLSVDINTVVHLACEDAENGLIDISVSGGLAPFEYSWSKAGEGYLNINDSIITELGGGLYNLVVTDNIGCESEQIQIIIGNSTINLENSFNYLDPKCFDSNDGFAIVNISNAYGDYTTTWSTNTFSDTLLNLNSGSYYVTVEDNAGCSLVDTIILVSPDSLYISQLDINNTHCLTVNSGSIEIAVLGGISPYEYVWSNFETTNIIDSLYPGTYTVEIQDSNNCLLSSQVIELSSNWLDLNINLSDIENLSCNGENDGLISLNLSGGNNLSYLWSNFDTTLTIDNLSPGNYTLTITDSYGCDTISPQYLISEPDTLSVMFDITSETVPTMNGTITSIGDGGTIPYDYYWDENTGSQEGAFIYGLFVGCYDVTMVDNNNCAIIDVACVQDIVEINDLENINSILLTPNPNNGIFNIKLNITDAVVEDIRIYDILGKSTVFSFTSSEQNNLNFTLDDHQNGIYYLVIYTSKGQIFKSFIVE